MDVRTNPWTRDGARPRIGLALGGGAARGWAHVGVLEALAEAGIAVDLVAGTSIGALIGAVYASGGIEAVRELAASQSDYRLTSFLDLALPRSGLVDGRKIEEMVRRHVAHERIEDFALPYCAVATDLDTAREVEITSGDAAEAVRASASVPGLFTPLRRPEGVLVDGGLVDPVPVGPCRRLGADRVIAVDITRFVLDDGLYPPAADDRVPSRFRLPRALRSLPGLELPEWLRPRDDRLPSVVEILTATVAINEITVTEMRLAKDPPDLLVQPRVGHVHFLDFSRAAECVEAGRLAMREALLAAGLAPEMPLALPLHG